MTGRPRRRRPHRWNAHLDAAAASVAAAGDKLTRPRRRVLELLLVAGAPAKAYDLVATYHREARVATPATVYRALQFLETRGLVHRLSQP